MYISKYNIIIFLIIILVLLIYLLNKNNENWEGKIKKNKYILMTQIYFPNNKLRKKEILECLHRNIKNNLVDQIILFGEKEEDISQILEKYNSVEKKKVKFINLQRRLAFRDCFKYGNKMVLKKEKNENLIFILCNSDIYFDKSLIELEKINFKKKFLAITRYNIKNDKSILARNPGTCQDTWIWKNQIVVSKDKKFKSYHRDGIKLGILGCDNYMVYLMNYSGYKIENPCRLINTFHLHQNDFRTWKNNNKLDYRKEFFQKAECY